VFFRSRACGLAYVELCLGLLGRDFLSDWEQNQKEEKRRYIALEPKK